MRIIIFGATGPTGQLILKQGLDKGYEITAVGRRIDTITIQHPHLHIIQADVSNATAVEQAIQGQDVVISVLGCTYSFKPISIYSTGTLHIIQAMQKHGLRRLLGVTSGGANPHFAIQEGIVFGLIIKRFIGRTLYSDMRRMEDLMTSSNLDWTIVRPARLIDTTEVSAYRTDTGYMVPGSHITARTDLADFLLKEAENNQYIKQGVAIATFK